MEYKQLNLRNRKKMNGICKSEIEMQWEDAELLNILLGNPPKARRTRDEDKVEKQIWHLEMILKSYEDLNKWHSLTVVRFIDWR